METMMQSADSIRFDHQPRTRLVFGNGELDQLGELACELGGRRVLLVTDRGIVAAGHAPRAKAILESAGLAVAVFDQTREDPSTADVARCVEAMAGHRADLLVGLGGGSSMDTAKGGNFIFTNGGEIRDYWGVGKATRPMLPLIAIPTTAGTGSECQCAALIADQQTHQKMACLDPKAAARIALLDPTLTLSQPARVTACTGIDAITHAVETAVTKARTPVSVMYSQAAFGHLVGAFPRVMANAGALDARGRMLLGAALAGSAIENSMLGAAHSAANPLTAHFDLPHGLAVGLMLPHVMRFNAAEDPATQRAYADLAASAGITAVGGNPAETVAALVARMEELLDLATCPRSLADCGIGRDAIPALAVEAARQWTAKFNPRPVGAEDFVGLYEAALSGRCR